MTYELWDTETGNLVEAFESEAEALAAVRELVILNTPAYPEALTLLAVAEHGRLTTLAQGPALGTLAQQASVRADRPA